MFYFTISDGCDDERLASFCTERLVGETVYSEHNRFHFIDDQFKFIKHFEGFDENVLKAFHKDILI